MKTKIHWKDWSEDIPCWINDTFFGYDLESMADTMVCHLDIDLEAPPTFANPGKKETGRFMSAADVAERMSEDWLCRLDRSWMRSYINAQTIWEWFCEDLYLDCDPEPYESVYEDAHGLDELQEALDRFESLNLLTWRMLGGFRWFKPEKHSFGLQDLQQALDKATAANAHHHVWGVDSSVQIVLDDEFWSEFIESDLSVEEGVA